MLTASTWKSATTAAGAGVAGPASPEGRLDDSYVAVQKLRDQLGHSKISTTQDRYLGRRLTDRQTAEVLEGLFDNPESEQES